MLRKAAIITAFDPFLFCGGIETYTLQLKSLLNSAGIKVNIYHTGLVDNAIESVEPKLRNPFLTKIFQLGRKVMHEDKDYDVIIANSFYGMGYFPPSKKTYTIFHSVYGGFTERYKDIWSDHPLFYYKWLCEEIGEYVSGYDKTRIAVSDAVRDELGAIYGFKDVSVVPHGIDTALFTPKNAEVRKRLRQRLSIPEDSFVGIYVGGWETEKGNNFMRSVIAQHPDIFWLLIVGRRSEECDVRGRPNVIVKEEVPYHDMPLMYSVADFMLLPSVYEGFGLVIIEAMASGLPVITTNVGIAKSIYRERPFHNLLLPDLFLNGENACTTIGEKIRVLRENPGFRSEVVDSGLALVRVNFTLQRWRREMEAVLGLPVT